MCEPITDVPAHVLVVRINSLCILTSSYVHQYKTFSAVSQSWRWARRRLWCIGYTCWFRDYGKNKWKNKVRNLFYPGDICSGLWQNRLASAEEQCILGWPIHTTHKAAWYSLLWVWLSWHWQFRCLGANWKFSYGNSRLRYLRPRMVVDSIP